jgi:hypothetical protein
MTDLRKAAEQALEALESLDCGDTYKTHNAASALRQALAHEALDRMVAENQRLGLYDDQQPVDLAKVGEVGVWGENGRLGLYEDEPVKRDKLSWVGLTEDELEDLEFASMDKKYGHLDVRVLSRAIEAKLKEKNNA